MWGEASSAPQLTLMVQGAEWMAVQDGEGPWRALELTARTPPELQVALTNPEGRYGVASVCPAGAGTLVQVQQATLAEGRRVVTACTPPQSVTGDVQTVWGEVSGLEGGEYASIYLGAHSTLVGSTLPQYRLVLPATATASTLDLIAARYKGDALLPERLVFEPDLHLRPGDHLEVDFTGPASFAPDVGTLTVRGATEGEVVSATVDFVSARGTRARLGEQGGDTSLRYARPPAARLQGTLHASVRSFSYERGAQSGSNRGLEVTLPHPAPAQSTLETPTVLMLPDALGPVTLTLRGPSATPRPAAAWPPYGAQSSSTQFYSQIRGERTLSYALRQSARWRVPLSPPQGDAEESYTLPDLSRLPGWEPLWSLSADTDLFWEVGFEGLPERLPSLGGAFQTVFASRSGVLRP